MPPRPARIGFSFGGRVPWGVGLVIALTVALSLLVAFGDRHAGSIFELTALLPAAVWRGQVWRLVTWAFIEPGPIALIFGCLFLYWFGSDLAREWGSRRFLRVYAGIILTAAIATCLVARVDSGVLDAAYLGGWTTGVGLTVAWGFWFPHREMRIYFLIPIRGYVLAWLTIAGTIVFAVYSGWERYVPELAAEGAVLLWLFRPTILARWTKLRKGMAARTEAHQREVVKRDRAKKRAKSVAYLRVVEANDDKQPDLPPELDAKLDDLLRSRSKRDRSNDN
ncbi:MAG: Rhomboid family protein [Labilithrix sp.]|nr:Rhomboid family protein [Labilithrix sp.]